jgi:glycerol-3-phosphate dehydrogenase (NAD(P)+)
MRSDLDKSKVKSNIYDHVGVIGGGSWGTALALVAAGTGRRVTVWARESRAVEAMKTRRENAAYLPGILLPENVVPTSDLREAAGADAVLLAVPAQHLRAVLDQAKARVKRHAPAVICAKGIERGTGKLMTEVLAECAPDAEPAILSGPSFARDVARHLPTAVTVAARMEVARRLQATLGNAQFRPYASDDLVGVALGGAAKNVYAIACGIVDGLGLGESARAALLARGFAELCRLGAALGARTDTLMGLSGLGDLVLTATSLTSRNFTFGLAIGSGRARADIFAPGRPLAEGVESAPALVTRARRHGIELPIAEAVSGVLDGSLMLEAAVSRLMMRPLKAE